MNKTITTTLLILAPGLIITRFAQLGRPKQDQAVPVAALGGQGCLVPLNRSLNP
ncbi:MAG: hypothetical protein WAV07_19480 [Candidatus Contendobacter sp.]